MKKLLFVAIGIIFAVIFAESVKELLRAGDHFFKRGEYSDALAKYSRAQGISPNDENIDWRIAAALNRIGMDLRGKAQIDTLKVANKYLTGALKKNKDIFEIHRELAWNLTYMVLMQGDWSDCAIARRIKEELDYALSLNVESADIYFIYGLWHRQVSRMPILKRKPNGLGDASQEKALKNLEKAVELEPNSALFMTELANQFLLDGDTAHAIRTLNDIEKIPDTPANRQYKQGASERLKELRN